MSLKRTNNKVLSVYKLALTIAILTLFFNTFSQDNVLFEPPDTLNNQYHISGSIDSVDAFTPYLMSSFPSAQSKSLFLRPAQLFYEGGSNAFIRSLKFKKTYSSLPHLGFAYTFGMQGFQSTKVNYTQAFQNKLIININILRSQATGLLRNSSWKNQYMSTKLYKTGKKVSSFLSLDFSTVTAENNGGVLNISDINTYSHDLLAVNKDNAFEEKRAIWLKQENFINLCSDSINQQGVFTKHHLILQNRQYQENDTLYGLYQNIYSDSLVTFDNLQNSKAVNTIGYYISRNKINFEIGARANFWSYHISNMYRDTLETDLTTSFSFKTNKFKLSQSGYFNLTGASNGWKNKIAVSKTGNSTNINLSWLIEARLPDLYKRHYLSNNHYYSNNSFLFQQTNRINASADFRLDKQKIKLNTEFISIKNPYIFFSNNWSPSVINQVNIFQIKLSANLNHKFLSIYPYYNFSLMPKNLTIYPAHHLGSRILIKGGVFKAKKLFLYGGVEPLFISSFNRIAYLPSMGIFDLNNIGGSNMGFFDLRFFTGFKLDSFKFFVRAENLNFLWTDKETQVIIGFPIPSVQIRMGLTWDFWN